MREKTVYTNGKKVTVTAYSLRVGKHLYPFDDIIRYGLRRVKPNWFPSIALMIAGAAVAAIEYFKVVPADVLYWVPDEVAAYDYRFSQSDIVTGTGILLSALGLISLFVLRVRYGVHVVTSFEDKNAVVTARRKHAEQIVDALDEGLQRKKMESMLGSQARTMRKEIV